MNTELLNSLQDESRRKQINNFIHQLNMMSIEELKKLKEAVDETIKNITKTQPEQKAVVESSETISSRPKRPRIADSERIISRKK